jgi:hypothetical protein
MIPLKQNEDFQKISPEKQRMIELLAASLEGQKLTDALPILTRWKKQMQQEHITLTPEEDKIITDILSEQLTPAQKKQFHYLKQILRQKKF